MLFCKLVMLSACYQLKGESGDILGYGQGWDYNSLLPHFVHFPQKLRAADRRQIWNMIKKGKYVCAALKQKKKEEIKKKKFLYFMHDVYICLFSVMATHFLL